jgi:aryl-alcohol dehydrogenase-like predicted oxidoreductase
MEYRTFGRTGLKVSVCGLGGGAESRLCLKEGSTEEKAGAVVRRAVDLGVTYSDTAADYGTRGRLRSCARGSPRRGRDLLQDAGPPRGRVELLELRAEGKIRAPGMSESTGTDARHSMLSCALQGDCWDVVMTGFPSARDVLFPTTSEKDICCGVARRSA